MISKTQFRRRQGEQGYALLYLLLLMALGAIAAGMITSELKFEMKRDREEEMIHRGVQYARAIRGYYKKFGRYPTKVEDLESANNLRFLRKRYKDPLNCKNSKCEDFKLLHFGEVQMTLSGMGGGTIPGATPVGGPGGLTQPTANTLGGTSSSSPYQNQAGTNNSGNPQDPSQADSPPDATDANGLTPTASGAAAPGTPGANQLGSGQVIGGAIVGVASLSKATTIREYNHKKKYKDWAFVYDPAQDTGRLITTPYQPQLQQGFGQGTPNLNGQNGPTNGPGNGFGNNNGFGGNNSFGSSSGFSNSPTSPSNSGFGSQNSSSGSSSNSPQQQ